MRLSRAGAHDLLSKKQINRPSTTTACPRHCLPDLVFARQVVILDFRNSSELIVN
jgi:hypothetical protein